jgi:hypothetical protein
MPALLSTHSRMKAFKKLRNLPRVDPAIPEDMCETARANHGIFHTRKWLLMVMPLVPSPVRDKPTHHHHRLPTAICHSHSDNQVAPFAIRRQVAVRERSNFFPPRICYCFIFLGSPTWCGSSGDRRRARARGADRPFCLFATIRIGSQSCFF